MNIFSSYHSDACAIQPCRNHGTCFQEPGAMFSCACISGWTGETCTEGIVVVLTTVLILFLVSFVYFFIVNLIFPANIILDVNECESSPCLNNGVCNNLFDRFTCDCNSDFRGSLCEISIIDISTALLSDTGTAILVIFEDGTDRGASVLGSTDCVLSDLFNAVTVSLLGSSASCTWITNSVLSLVLSSDASIIPYDTITSLPDVLLGDTPLSVHDGSTVTVEAPISAIAPSIVMTAPSIVGCEPARVLASVSGLAGREGTVVWSLLAMSTDNPTNLQRVSALLSASAQQLTVTLNSSDLVPFTTYSFALNVTNWLGKESVSLFDIQTEELTLPIPQLLAPSPGSVFRMSPVTLSTSFSLARCFEQVSTDIVQYNFTWSLVSGPTSVPLDNTFDNGRQLRIPALTLQSGGSYTLRISANSSGLLSTSSLVSFDVLSSPLQAVISGGSDFQILNSRESILNGSLSFDPDEESGGIFAYQWTCSSISSDANCSRLLSAGVSFTSSELILPALSLDVGFYVFFLNYSHSGNGNYSP